MTIELIDQDTSERLEELSVEQNKSKGEIAVLLCEKFFGKGVPHRIKVRSAKVT